MKLFVTLALAFATTPSASSSKSPFGARTALKVRGGGVLGTPITQENLFTLYSGFYGLNGVLSMPAPEFSGDNANGSFPKLTEGTSDYVIYENLGAVSLAYAILVYQTAFSSKSTYDAIASAVIPVAYVTLKNAMKGLTYKLTGTKNFGPATSVLMIGLIYMILTGRGDTKNLTKLLCLPPLVIGTIAQLDMDKALKIAGLGTPSKTGRSFFMWYAALSAGFGVLSYMLLYGRDATESIGYAALLETIFMIDCIWLRKFNADFTDASNYVFLAIPLVTAIGTLLK